MRSRMRFKSHVRFWRVTVQVTDLSTLTQLPQKNQTLLYEK